MSNTRPERLNAFTGTAEFLNVDFDVKSRTSLVALRDAWPEVVQDAGSNMSPRRQWLIFHGPGQPKTAERAIRSFFRIIASLPPAARAALKQASSRTFDIGVQAGLAPSAFEEVTLSPQALQEVGRLNARVLVTLYAPRSDGEVMDTGSLGRPTRR